MNPALIRSGTNARISEAQDLLSMVRQYEADLGRAANRNLIGTLKGMIYVSLYAALEHCVSNATDDFLGTLTALDVRPTHLEYVVAAVALDAHLAAYRDAGQKNKWRTRRAVFERFAANDPCAVPDNVFGTFLHNVWPKTIDEVFKCLGVNKPTTQHPSEIGYLREIVEKRNGVAHGRFTAAEAAEGITNDDIQKRIDVTYSVCIYFLNTLDEHATERMFIRPRYRRNYRAI